MHSYLIVREDDKIRYTGCDPYPSELISRLPDYKDDSSDSSDGFYLGGKIKALVSRLILRPVNTERAVFLWSPVCSKQCRR